MWKYNDIFQGICCILKLTEIFFSCVYPSKRANNRYLWILYFPKIFIYSYHNSGTIYNSEKIFRIYKQFYLFCRKMCFFTIKTSIKKRSWKPNGNSVSYYIQLFNRLLCVCWPTGFTLASYLETKSGMCLWMLPAFWMLYGKS